jgi:diguanylate cyclase (GGDEF)-like protein
VGADKVRRSVADFHFAGEEKIPEGSITISVGVAAFPKDSDEEWALIHKADLALYSAKQTGRNSVAKAF